MQIRIWARRRAIEEGHGDYALSLTGPILDFFQEYYKIPYPLYKSGKPPPVFFILVELIRHTLFLMPLSSVSQKLNVLAPRLQSFFN